MLFKRIRDIIEHKSGLKSIIMGPAPVGKPLKVKSTFSGRTGALERQNSTADLAHRPRLVVLRF